MRELEVTKPSIAFVACTENGLLAAQAQLLFESLRRFGGRFKDSPCYALSPRAGHTLGPRATKALEALEVAYIDEVINTDCAPYGSANRVAAAGYVEARTDCELVVVLDSDTLILREPSHLVLSHDLDVAARPVDVKGMCTSGADDPNDRYWRALCAAAQVPYDAIPTLQTTVDRVTVKASYNAGLVVARRSAGIMQRWGELFFRSIRMGLSPRKKGLTLRSGMGMVAPEAGQLWGSNQAALSLAMWSTTRAVGLLPPTYNFPLHLDVPSDLWDAVFDRLVHAHYHWLCEPNELQNNPLLVDPQVLSAEQRAWLVERLPLRPITD